MILYPPETPHPGVIDHRPGKRNEKQFDTTSSWEYTKHGAQKTFTEGMVRGRGWIAIALTFFGGWSPHLILLGSLFFAGIEVLALRVQIGGFGIPCQFLLTLPYIATILVMMFAFKWVRAPAFLGQNYDRERRTLT